jgi:hypothetical protein
MAMVAIVPTIAANAAIAAVSPRRPADAGVMLNAVSAIPVAVAIAMARVVLVSMFALLLAISITSCDVAVHLCRRALRRIEAKASYVQVMFL